MNETSVLVVDEPTSALDSRVGSQVIDLLLRLTSVRSTATLVVTHDRAVAARAHDQRRMVDGRLSQDVGAAGRVPLEG